jgi:hypothetical protein
MTYLTFSQGENMLTTSFLSSIFISFPLFRMQNPAHGLIRQATGSKNIAMIVFQRSYPTLQITNIINTKFDWFL